MEIETDKRSVSFLCTTRVYFTIMNTGRKRRTIHLPIYCDALEEDTFGRNFRISNSPPFNYNIKFVYFLSQSLLQHHLNSPTNNMGAKEEEEVGEELKLVQANLPLSGNILLV